MVFRSRNICPPGVFCLTPGILILFVTVVIGVFIYLYNPLQMVPMQLQMQMPQQPPVNVNVMTSDGSDGRYSRPPRPQRRWDNGP